MDKLMLSDRLDTFVEKYLERYPGVCTQTFCRMLGLWSGTPVDFVGRTESLKADLTTALSMAGEDFDPVKIARLPRFNRSKVEAPELSNALQSRIMEAESDIVERFYS